MEGGKSMVAKYDKDEELKRTRVRKSGLLNKGSISPIMAKMRFLKGTVKK